MVAFLIIAIAGLVFLGASTVSAVITASITVTETLSTSESPLIDSSDATIKEKIAVSTTLNSSSSPDAELHAAMQQALTAGAATIDFTALTRHGGGSVSFAGKAVRAISFQNPTTNANEITIANGASDSLDLFGATYSITLQPGQTLTAYLAAVGPTVGANDKNVDISGTGSQVLNMIAVAG